MNTKKLELSGDEIKEQVLKRLVKYKKLNLLEHFAMFMGMAQVLELGLKNLAARLYEYKPEEMEKWTLGQTKAMLKQRGLRGDFIALLESVSTYRNDLAHEFLANQMILRSILGGDTGMLGLESLYKGTYELEQVIFLHDWIEEHNGSWDDKGVNQGA